MKIPKDYNTRAEAMWRIISQRVDFRKKNVIDLGCGHGEMLWRCHIAGANNITGIDKNETIQKQIPYYSFLNFSLEGFIDINLDDKSYDIAICFSVLPYLDDPKEFATWMANTFRECLIEVQYLPEPYNIGVSNDDEMHKWLREAGFEIAIPLGKTYVEIRDVHRSIWYCTREKTPLGLK